MWAEAEKLLHYKVFFNALNQSLRYCVKSLIDEDRVQDFHTIPVDR